MKKFLLTFVILMALFTFAACGNDEPTPVEARAVYTLDRLYLDEEHADLSPFEGARLTFIGEEAGGTVIIHTGDDHVVAYINPNRSHPSFESGYWHHHLYAGATAPGSPRINFRTALAGLGIDANPDATDNTQSSYQHGNLHYIVETGEFRLRFTADSIIHDLIFVQN
ncbi:MAG: hypothetical protein FWB98_02535 [Defluviitaleaceae bacterium]|nr:hypothetical protein [Defluviitaleaceae bacterium]